MRLSGHRETELCPLLRRTINILFNEIISMKRARKKKDVAKITSTQYTHQFVALKQKQCSKVLPEKHCNVNLYADLFSKYLKTKKKKKKLS